MFDQCVLPVLTYGAQTWTFNETRANNNAGDAESHEFWKYAGHLARVQGTRWNRRILEWRPWTGQRGRGRPIIKWYDDIKKAVGLH